jgi:Leucine-rich repeat (LRR) protein
LTNLDVLSPEFVNLNRLNINLNKVKDLSKITQFKHLEKLYANDNGYE